MKILIIEDELELLKSITEYLLQEDFRCETATNFKDASYLISGFNYDCIILDINLPDGNGLALLKLLREEKKKDGVIIISARNSLEDKIIGLNLGADDYLVKPFHLSELNARIKACMRRQFNEGIEMMEIGNLIIDPIGRSAQCNGQPLQFTKNEFDLIAYLLNNKNRVVSRQAIAEHIYGNRTDLMPSFDFVYSQIKNIKRKLKEANSIVKVETIYGLGYKISI